ncbi:alpha/beta fold hydrolase [Brevibacterium sp.]|uniref:alpha/beta fold hydrolase n=1 Tax=Brevibacterium sp. TaxID=1701 RepID=UPI002811CA6A|nr:alpha/beta fold hydrolase [Brevibacterium sp.]
MEQRTAQSDRTAQWYEMVEVVWKERIVTVSSGVRICIQELGPTSGEPIVLIHGGGDCRVSWSYVAPILAEAGYRIIVPELRGHGGTEVPETALGYYLNTDYAADIEGLIDELGFPAVHLVGHSLGSITSQTVAFTAPQKVKSVTLIASGALVKAFSRVEIDPNEAMDEEFLEAWARCDLDEPAFVEAIRSYVFQMPVESWAKVLNGVRHIDTRSHLGEIRCPVQLIWGTEDDVFDADDQEVLRSGLSGTTVRFLPIDGASHSPHWDSRENIELIAGAIDSFVADWHRV